MKLQSEIGYCLHRVKKKIVKMEIAHKKITNANRFHFWSFPRETFSLDLVCRAAFDPWVNLLPIQQPASGRSEWSLPILAEIVLHFPNEFPKCLSEKYTDYKHASTVQALFHTHRKCRKRQWTQRCTLTHTPFPWDSYYLWIRYFLLISFLM